MKNLSRITKVPGYQWAVNPVSEASLTVDGSLQHAKLQEPKII